ncbi:MAG TPA: threonine synthase, partial [Verrucomicrobiae bacterium]
MLQFRSTNGQSPLVNLREAMLEGQAPDRGLYLPVAFPKLTPAEIAGFSQLPYHEIAARVLAKLADGIVPPGDISAMCQSAYNFPVPLEVVNFRTFLMRLDQGPTASFKDFAAQMMARLFG